MRKQGEDIELLEKLQSMPGHKMSPAAKSRLFKNIKEGAARYEKSYARNLVIKRLTAGFACCAAALLIFLTVSTPQGQEYTGRLWTGIASLTGNKGSIAPENNDDGSDTLRNFIFAYYTVNQSDYDYYEEITNIKPSDNLRSQMDYEANTKKFEQYLSQKSYDNFYNTRLSTGRIAAAYNKNIFTEVKTIKLEKFREDTREKTIGYSFELQLDYINRGTKASEAVTRTGTLTLIKENGQWKIVDEVGPPNSPFPGTGGSNSITPSPAKTNAKNIFSGVSQASMSMANENFGWAVLDKSVFYTPDGGLTWQDVTPKGLAGNRGIKGFFLDSSHGWLSLSDGNNSVTIYRTANGGKSWDSANCTVQSQAQGSTAQLQFLDAKNGYMLVHQGIAMHHEEVTLLKTADGGASWSIVSVADLTGTKPDTLPFVGDKTGFSFSNIQNGFITGEEPMEGYAYVFKTNDGGKTWNDAAISVPSSLKNAYLVTLPPVFFNSTDGILPVRVSAETQSVVFFKTSDGAKTWKAGGSLATSPDNETVWDFIDAKTGFAVSGNKLYQTVDGGLTWASIPSSMDFTNSKAIDFVSSKTGWVVKDGVLYKTTVGGRTWNPAQK